MVRYVCETETSIISKKSKRLVGIFKIFKGNPNFSNIMSTDTFSA